MGEQRKRHWLLNVLIVVTFIVVTIVFAAHYKNWTKIEKDYIEVLSGVYYKKLQFSGINSVKMVDKIPSMKRLNGFSAMKKEKGIFKDSISGNKVYVYVDNLSGPKIQLVYEDSLLLFLNFSDSTETQKIYQLFLSKIDTLKK